MGPENRSAASRATLGLGFALALALSAQAACGGKPLPPSDSQPAVAVAAKRRAALIDDCAQEPGKPAPEALKREYLGVAHSARCDREVYTLMGGVVHSLGVECEYCHVKDDYPAMTHRKQVANWMAQELIPSIRAKTGEEVWCKDCHHNGTKGTPKPLGKPRKQTQAVEWMNLELAARFETKAGEPLFCKGCHGGNLGTPEFKAKLILTDLMGDGSYSHAAPPVAPAPPAVDAGAPDATPTPAGSDGVTDMGDRK